MQSKNFEDIHVASKLNEVYKFDTIPIFFSGIYGWDVLYNTFSVNIWRLAVRTD